MKNIVTNPEFKVIEITLLTLKRLSRATAKKLKKEQEWAMLNLKKSGGREGEHPTLLRIKDRGQRSQKGSKI